MVLCGRAADGSAGGQGQGQGHGLLSAARPCNLSRLGPARGVVGPRPARRAGQRRVKQNRRVATPTPSPRARPRLRPRLAAIGLAVLGLLAAERPLICLAADSAPAPPALAVRPASLQASITLEGTAEPIALRLFEWTPPAPSPGLSTYVPQDIVPRPSAAGAAPTLRFVANFGAVMQAQAYLEMAWLPAAASRRQALASTGRVAPGAAPLRRRSPARHQFGWSLAEYDIAYRDKTGSRIAGVTALGRHGGRYFKLTLHYPLEYGAGFGPRAELILKEWRWRDTQSGL